MLIGLSYLVYLEAIINEGQKYIEVILAAVAFCFVVGTDFHFTQVVKFYANNPVKRSKIKWLSSDSEPQFQF